MTMDRILSRHRIAATAALGAIVFILAWAADGPPPRDELVNRPDGSNLCGRRVAACEYRM